MSDPRDQLLADLTDPQREAVMHTEGALLILAGPGSGKTRVVTRRAAHLACTTCAAHQILAITFTNKAANEMRQRIETLGVASGMTVCTFHALCARLLRMYHEKVGIARHFTILDREDRRKVIKAAIKEAGLSTDNFQPAAVDQTIGLAKNELRGHVAYEEKASDWREESIARIYTTYEAIKASLEALDFDDLLMQTANLLASDKQVREALSDRFRYVLIDEYQDTNAAQYAIAHNLTQAHGNVCATGDPDQSIYGWRGADIGNILTFERDYPGATIVRLEQNFRSSSRILKAADSLIAHNVSRKQKSLWTENDEGAPIRVWETETGEDEARMIALDIANRLESETEAGEIAVFYRVNSLSRGIEEALLRRGISYQVARGVEFYNRKEIKDVLCYVRAVVNPSDEVALLRIINTPPRGIGATTVKRLTDHARRENKDIAEVLRDSAAIAQLGRSSANVALFAALIDDLRTKMELPADQALAYVISQTGLRAHHASLQVDEEGPGANLDELIGAAAAFQNEQPDATIVEWLEETALISDVDSVKTGEPSVTLMTLHAAKGLEYKVVYILGMEDGLLPFYRDDDDQEDDEEERRLCFVGITRAKNALTLSRARYRSRRGMATRTVRSPFLDELPVDELEWDERQTGKGGAIRQKRDLPGDIDQWMTGTLVEHPVYGLGQIMSLWRSQRATTADVLFKAGERKTFNIGFAELKRVDVYDVD